MCTVVQPHNFSAPVEGVDQQDCEVGQSVEGTLRETRLVSLGFCMLFICAYRKNLSVMHVITYTEFNVRRVK